MADGYRVRINLDANYRALIPGSIIMKHLLCSDDDGDFEKDLKYELSQHIEELLCLSGRCDAWLDVLGMDFVSTAKSPTGYRVFARLEVVFSSSKEFNRYKLSHPELVTQYLKQPLEFTTLTIPGA